MSRNTRSAAIRVIVGVPLALGLANGLLLGGCYLLFTLTHERRPIPLEEITRRTGLQFPAGTVLVGSHLDAVGKGGVSFAARTHVPRKGYGQLLNSLPENGDVAHGNETNSDIWSVPDTFSEESWWTPEQMRFSLRVQLHRPGGRFLLGAEESNPKYVDVLLYAQVD